MVNLLILLALTGLFQIASSPALAQKKNVTLVIDPGHGGKDPGKPQGSPKKLHEKDINLKIALKLGKLLSEKVPNLNIIYTRKKDKYVSLEDRVSIANLNQADYFLSIHCNSNPNRWIAGTKSHIHSNSFSRSKQLAYRIEEEFKTRAARKSRGVMSAYDRGYNLYVLQFTEMPGVLVEAGFLSNPTEEKYLNSDHGQNIIASAIYRAFKDYLAKNNQLPSSLFKVQIMASNKKVPLDSQKFRNLGMKVEEHRMGTGEFIYKYMVGNEPDDQKARSLAEKVKRLGFKDAFVVRFR